jgi:hypothetical protein
MMVNSMLRYPKITAYAFGMLGSLLHEVVLGVDSLAPGLKGSHEAVGFEARLVKVGGAE